MLLLIRRAPCALSAVHIPLQVGVIVFILDKLKDTIQQLTRTDADLQKALASCAPYEGLVDAQFK